MASNDTSTAPALIATTSAAPLPVFQARIIKLFCWVLNISRDPFSFPIHVEESTTVDHLKKRIVKEKPNTFVNIDSDDLKLWKVSFPITSVMDTVNDHQFLAEDSLPAGNLLSETFPPPNPVQKTLHIVVRLPPAPVMIDDRADKRVREEEDVPRPIKRLKYEVGKAAPSSLAHPEQFKKITGPIHAVCCNRPFELDTIPLVLLHESFGIFTDRCEKPPSEDALLCLNELSPVACQWYESELERRTKIRNVLANHLGLQFKEQKIPGTEYTTNGNLVVIVMPAAIRVCKNEHGDPLNQAIVCYLNFLRNAFESPHKFHNCDSRFPCVLLIDMGSYLGFYGAAWDGERARVEPLSPGFDLATHRRESKAREAIASSFDGLVLAVRNIQGHYQKIHAEAQAKHASAAKVFDERLQLACGFPFLTSYEDDDGTKISFTYNRRLDDTKLLFSAITIQHEPAECVVKFTRHYSQAAHHLLATYDSAPKLGQCIPISAGWTAVVMDRSNYKTLYDLNLTRTQRNEALQKVQKIAKTLHDNGIVHGDIRNTNILVDSESLDSGDVKVHFVDFDWAGKIGEAKYPNGLNRTTVRRPKGVKGGALITVEHDNEMISYLE